MRLQQSKSRLSRSSSVILNFAVMAFLVAGLAWPVLGWQGKAKATTEKPVAKKPADAAKPANAKKPVEAKPTAEVKKTADKVSTVAVTAIEKLHPAKSVFLYVWDGTETHQKTWEATGFQKAFIGTGIGEKLRALVEHFNDTAGSAREKWLIKLGVKAMSNGASLSVAVNSESNPPEVHVTFVLHNSAEVGKELNDLFNGELQEANPQTETISGREVTRVAIPQTEGYEFGWWTEGKDLVIAGGLKGIEATLEVATGKRPNLATNATYQKLRKSEEFEVASVSIVDAKGLLDLVRQIEVPQLPGSDKPAIKVEELLKIGGIDQLGLITARWGFRGEAIWTESDLQVPAPLTGLMALYDQKPLTLKDLPPLPANCEYFYLGRHDISKTYASVIKMAEAVAEKIAPADAPPLAHALDVMNETIGFDLGKDLMEPLGDTTAFYVEGTGIVPAGVLLLKLDDSKKIDEVSAKIRTALEGFQGQVDQRRQFGMSFEVRTRDTLGRKLNIVQFAGQAFVSPTWVVDKDWLVIGTTSQAIEAYLKRVDGKLAKWQPPAEIAATQKMLPQTFTTFYYSDPRGALKYGLNFAPTGIAALEEMFTMRERFRQQDLGQRPEATKFPITPEDVPVAEEITGPLFPSIGTCTVDATGIHWRNRNSVPGLLPIPGLPGAPGGLEGTLSLVVNPAFWLFGVRSVVHLQPPAAEAFDVAVPAERAVEEKQPEEKKEEQ